METSKTASESLTSFLGSGSDLWKKSSDIDCYIDEERQWQSKTLLQKWSAWIQHLSTILASLSDFNDTGGFSFGISTVTLLEVPDSKECNCQ